MVKKNVAIFLGAILILAAALTTGIAVKNYWSAQISSSFKGFDATVKLKTLTDLGLFSIVNKQNNLTLLSADKKPIILSIQNATSAVAVSQQFLREYSHYFGVINFASELTLLKQKKDDLGLNHFIYEQKYNNVPVYGGQLAVHLNKDLTVNFSQGKIFTGLSLSANPKISLAKVPAIAKKIGQQDFKMVNPIVQNSRLYIYPDPSGKDYLVWSVLVTDSHNGNSKILLLDAQGGKLVHYFEADKSIFKRIFNCYNVLDADCYGWTRNDNNQSGRSQGDRAVGISDVDQAYSLLNSAHNYFSATFGLNGANNHGGAGDIYGVVASKLATTTDARVQFVYYDDTTKKFGCPNASWNGSVFKFCTTTVNAAVVGHEYTHAVVDFNGASPPLAYEGETGAVEEALADIFGQAVERYITGASSWINKYNNGHVVRNIKNPNLSHQPVTYYSPDFFCGAISKETDYGGVHQNSTVVSHMAYLLSEGGVFNGCTIEALGHTKVERLFYDLLDRYFWTNDNFESLNYLLPRICYLRYGRYSSECFQVKKALTAAELDQPGKCSGVAEKIPSCPAIDPDLVNALREIGNNSRETGSSSSTASRPDFIVVEGSVGSNPASPQVGNWVSFNGTVKNVGPGAIGNFISTNVSQGQLGASTIYLQIDLDSDGDWDITKTVYTPPLNVNKTSYAKWSSAWKALAGTHIYRVCADGGAVILESNENNNCVSKTLVVK